MRKLFLSKEFVLPQPFAKRFNLNDITNISEKVINMFITKSKMLIRIFVPTSTDKKMSFMDLVAVLNGWVPA